LEVVGEKLQSTLVLNVQVADDRKRANAMAFWNGDQFGDKFECSRAYFH